MMTAEAKEARAAYYREYYRNNKAKIKSQREKYWQKKAEELKATEEKNNENE